MATHVSLCFEVDERRFVENALRESEHWYRTIFEGSSEGFLIMTDIFLDCNEQACRIWRCSKEDIIGHSPLEFSPEFQPDGRSSADAAREYIEAAMSGAPQRFYWKHKRKDRILIDTEISLTPLEIERGKILFATLVDVTERRQVEESLRQAEEKYRSIFENSIEGIFQTTANGKFLTANLALARMYGYDSPEDLIASVTDIGQQLYYDPARRLEFLAEIKKEGSVRGFEVKALRKDGRIAWLSVNAKSIHDERGRIKYYEGMIQDITEKKKLEEQLRHSQKMEAIGALAGGVAHDFNNILTVIMGYAHLMLLNIKPEDTMRQYLSHIIGASEKASGLTNSLLAYSRKQMIRLNPVNLNELVKNVEKILSRILGEDIELKTFLAEDELIIMADSGQIEQVLFNLATNARDAMPDGGLLIIETEQLYLDEEYARTHGYGKAGAYALLTFSDFGVGMDKNTMEKIFEPFFTTKEPLKGTGLGLSMAYGIVKQHGGYINVYSEPGKGTTFKIYLPLTEQKAVSHSPAAHPATLTGKETILIAEDDPNIRNLTKFFLEKYGYRAIEAVDGEDAVEKFKQNEDSIDLLLFDVIMPKMNGKAAYDEIKKIKPDINAIFISGYTANIIHKKGVIEEGLNIIFKPISPLKLLEEIRRALSEG
jgi:PAS domain S-box-containing protein